MIGDYKNEVVPIGKNVTFQCTCHNGTVQWMLNEERITVNNTRYNTTSDNTLTILEVRSSDSGNYSCDSNSEYIVSLTVKSKSFYKTMLTCTYLLIVPIITITGRYTEITIGSSVSINCTTVPFIPNSVIKWQSSSFNSDSNELIINPVMLSHNNKTFTCVVSSDLLDMSLKKDITITVLG